MTIYGVGIFWSGWGYIYVFLEWLEIDPQPLQKYIDVVPVVVKFCIIETMHSYT